MTNEELIAKIKAEIERRIKENESWKDFHSSKGGTTNFDDVKIVELQSLLSFISTLESEKPMQEGLEEEIGKSIENLEGCTTKVGGAPEYHLISDEDLREFARHFAQWGAEHLKIESEKPVPNDLEEAAEKEYPCDKSWMTPDMLDLNAHKQVAFRKGAKWQKEQMMKEAVEWTVTTNLANRPVIYLDQLKGFQYGDKVRIIIVKEDEK